MLYFGCTHYPIVENEIKEVLGDDVTFFNGAPNLAKHLKDILEEKNWLGHNERKIQFIDSQNSDDKKVRFFELLKNGEKHLIFE